MTEEHAPASGEYTQAGRPDGFTSVTPFIVVDGASRAIDFYAAVFGATVTTRLEGAPGDDGVAPVMHAELDFGSGRLQLSDPNDAFGLVAPVTAEGTSESFAVYLPDVDAAFERAVSLGATAVQAPEDFASGDRFGTILDPFGRRWNLMTRVEDLSPAESERRVAEWSASLGG